MSDESKALSTTAESSPVALGMLQAETPAAMLTAAAAIATPLAKFITDQGLAVNIPGGRKAHVTAEGWTTLLTMLGITVREGKVERFETEKGLGFEAIVELVRLHDGMIVGSGGAICSPMESNWESRDDFQRRSMAVTRATVKAARLSFSWIMTLAGYSPTPMEEMSGIGPNEQGHSQQQPMEQRSPQPKPSNEMADGVKKMQSRFAGSCAICGGEIPTGSDMAWKAEKKAAAHWDCYVQKSSKDAASTAKPATKADGPPPIEDAEYQQIDESAPREQAPAPIAAKDDDLPF